MDTNAVMGREPPSLAAVVTRYLCAALLLGLAVFIGYYAEVKDSNTLMTLTITLVALSVLLGVIASWQWKQRKDYFGT